jgi:putative ABC transport system permease protein
VDGSFTLGAAVSAVMISLDYDPWIATSVAVFAGGVAGSITGYLNVRWDILGLLAGILTMTALYSINLRIMGKPNIAIINKATIFNFSSIIIVSSVVIISVILLLSRLFASDLGP